MGIYPWGETNPSQLQVNMPDTVRAPGTHLAFRDRGTPPNSNGESHNWAAAFGSDLTPTDSEMPRRLTAVTSAKTRDRNATTITDRERRTTVPIVGPSAGRQQGRITDEFGHARRTGAARPRAPGLLELGVAEDRVVVE